MATGNAPTATVPVIPPPINTKEFFGDKNKDKDYTISAFIDHVNKAISLNKWVGYAGGSVRNQLPSRAGSDLPKESNHGPGHDR